MWVITSRMLSMFIAETRHIASDVIECDVMETWNRNIYIYIYMYILYNGLAHHFIVPWMPVHNCKKPVLVCRVLCFTTTWTMYCWCYACFSNFHVLFYLVSPSLVVVIFFIAQCNPIICMMIKEDNKVSVFCTFEDNSSSNPLSTQGGSNHSCVVWTLEN